MSFDTNTYLSWYLPRIRGSEEPINLHASGVRPLPLTEVAPDRANPWLALGACEEALAHWLGLPADELLFVPGATGGTLLALLGLCQPGARLLVEQPIYEPMLRQALRLGPVERLNRRSEQSWALPLVEAERRLSSPAGAVLITEPHNPSGCFAPREQVLALADLARRQEAFLLINEVYRGYSDQPSYHGAADNIIVVSSFSKLFGTYSARLGWLSGPATLIRRLRLAQLNGGSPSSLSAAQGVAVVSRADELRQNAQAGASAGLGLVDTWVKATPGLSWCRPQGPGFGCVRLPSGLEDLTLAQELHERRNVLVIPGSLFEAPGTLRLSWLQAGDHLQAGLDAVAEVLGDAVQSKANR